MSSFIYFLTGHNYSKYIIRCYLFQWFDFEWYTGQIWTQSLWDCLTTITMRTENAGRCYLFQAENYISFLVVLLFIWLQYEILYAYWTTCICCTYSLSSRLNFIIFLSQTLSSWATSSVEEVASTGPDIRFFQLYVGIFSSVMQALILIPRII